MLKIEYVWRELLYKAIEEGNPYFTITELAGRFNLSTSLVSHAVLPLRDLNMVEIGKIKSKIVDTEKLLFFWATRRNLKSDIIYQTGSPLPVFEREALMPSHVVPTAYTACRLYFNILPSDYEKIYFYADDLGEIEKRFPENSREANIFILKKDPYLSLYKKIPLGQVFADVWNLPDWYAKEFQEAVLAKIRERIGL